MPDTQKPFFVRIANDLGLGIGGGLRELRGEFSEAVQAIDKMAGQAAVGAERLYEDLRVGDRMVGATAGAKVGIVLGAAAALVGLKVVAVPVIIAGSAAGIVAGPSGVKKYRAWVDRHRDAANDEGPKPPSV